MSGGGWAGRWPPGESKLDEWGDRLAEAAEHLVNEDMRRSADFLIIARSSNQGWSAYPGLPVDLRATAEAVTALTAMRHPEARTIAGSAQLAARSRLTDLDGLPLADLIDLAFIANADHDDGDHLDVLAEALTTATGNLGTISTTTLARALVAVTPWRRLLRERVAGAWVTELLRRRAGDGGWRALDDVAGDPPAMTALPATAAAVRALAGWRSRPDVAEAVGNGLSQLRALLREDGWEHPSLVTTYPLASVVRALAVEADRDADLVLGGVQRLCALRDTEGAWGGTLAEAPSVEHTATAVIALVEAGACQYVPLATSRAGIQALSQLVRDVIQERDALTMEIDRRVAQRSGDIIADRDSLRAERESLRDRLRERDRELDRLRRRLLGGRLALPSEPDEEGPRAPRGLRQRVLERWDDLLPIVVGLTAVIAAVYELVPSARGGDNMITSIILLALFVAGVGAIVLTLERFRQSLQEVRSGRPRPSRLAQQIVNELVMATREVPTAAREELLYRLVREGPELPAEPLRRLLTELTGHWRVNRETDRRLHSWIDGFVALDLEDRQAVAERIRSGLL